MLSSVRSQIMDTDAVLAKANEVVATVSKIVERANVTEQFEQFYKNDIIAHFELVATGLVSMSAFIWLLSRSSTCIGEHVAYGKTRNPGTSFSIPKRWFTHFYLFSLVWTCTVLSLVHFNPHEIWSVVKSNEWFGRLSSTPRHISITTSAIAFSLLAVHAARRLFESLGVLHYGLGFLHYLILPLSVLCESSLVSSPISKWEDLKFDSITNLQWIGVALFVFSSYEQNVIARQLAELRTHQRSNADAGDAPHYAIPSGGWFELVSAPHFLFEILIYFALLLVLRGGHAFTWVFIFVLCNQTLAGLMTHHWWRAARPEDYPKTRKAVFPYLL